MTYLLDTNVCIDHLRRSGQGALGRRLAVVDPTEVALCSVVIAELVAGALYSGDPQKNLSLVRDLQRLFHSLPFDDGAAEHAGAIDATLRRQGNRIGANDLLIASIARSRDLVLATNNTREFSRVPGLRVEDWHSIP